MVERLADDHRTAKQLAEGLHCVAPTLVDPKSIATNIVRVSPGGPMQLRFVTHRHISPPDIEATLQAFRDLWREAPRQQKVRAG